MARSVERKEHPLSMRLPETDIAIIDRAAALRGRSRTDFVRDAAVRAAEDVLMETAPIRMSPSGFKAFMATRTGCPGAGNSRTLPARGAMGEQGVFKRSGRRLA
ncbi:uncharacterized protein (DUF1778 family) [Bradyrhizobium sp. cir1]|nr:uncharacterized protein (DUF1778 family) [Bradyrhizobium sp. cir1]